jgi:hypothetical protein
MCAAAAPSAVRISWRVGLTAEATHSEQESAITEADSLRQSQPSASSCLERGKEKSKLRHDEEDLLARYRALLIEEAYLLVGGI